MATKIVHKGPSKEWKQAHNNPPKQPEPIQATGSELDSLIEKYNLVEKERAEIIKAIHQAIQNTPRRIRFGPSIIWGAGYPLTRLIDELARPITKVE